MAIKIKLHPETPHIKRVFEIVDHLRRDDVILLPSDSGYSLACRFGSKKAVERIKQIRRLPDGHHFTLLTKDLATISDLSHMDTDTFKLIRKVIPASVTFILKASKVVPKLLINPKKSTIGIRVPDHPITQSILTELGEPLFVTTAKLPDINLELVRDPDEFQRAFDSLVDIIISDEQDVQFISSSIINVSQSPAVVLRKGQDYEKLEEAMALSQLSFEEAEALS
jgi:tRNA threonylcarbamoyl adenosine modification protein (Sua5/YciO/YrdC/YwlC family)